MNAPAWNRADEAENAVIAAVLMEGSKALASARSGGLSEGHFFQPKAQAAFRAACSVESASKPIDVITVADELRAAGDSELVGIDWLASLRAEVHHSPAAHGEIIMERARLRELEGTLQTGIEEIRGGEVQDTSALALGLSNSISNVGGGQKRGTSSREAVAIAFSAWAARARSPRPPGTPTGLPDLDSYHMLKPGKVVTLAARPSVGKSAMGIQWLGSAVSLGVPWMVHTIEMDLDECVGRMFAQRAGIAGRLWTTGQGSVESDVRAITSEGERIAAAPIEWHEGSEAARILGAIERWAQDPRMRAALARANAANASRRGDEVIPADFSPVAMIDHLHIVGGKPDSMNKVEFLSLFTASCKRLARKYKVTILVLCQLSRNNVRDQREPRQDDLRGSGGIEENSDSIVLLHRDVVGEQTHVATAIVAKNRGGKTGRVDLEFDGSRTKFTPAPARFDA